MSTILDRSKELHLKRGDKWPCRPCIAAALLLGDFGADIRRAWACPTCLGVPPKGCTCNDCGAKA